MADEFADRRSCNRLCLYKTARFPYNDKLLKKQGTHPPEDNLATHTTTRRTERRKDTNTGRRAAERAEKREKQPSDTQSVAGLRLLFGLVLTAAVVIGVVLAIRSTGTDEAVAAPAETAPAVTAIPDVSQPAADPAAVPVEAAAGLPPKPDIDPDSWELRLVRYDQQLPPDFAPDLMDVDDKQLFDVRAGMHLQKMLADARAAGFTTFICSGYRSYETQHFLYWQHVDQFMKEQGMTQEEAEATTRIAVNYPGASEHQLGLAADVLEFQGQDMEPYIGQYGLMVWLREHCADYGFIVRYPEDKTDITGIEYEPWHLRFVGTCAHYIMDNGLCLEEFLALYE